MIRGDVKNGQPSIIPTKKQTCLRNNNQVKRRTCCSIESPASPKNPVCHRYACPVEISFICVWHISIANEKLYLLANSNRPLLSFAASNKLSFRGLFVVLDQQIGLGKKNLAPVERQHLDPGKNIDDVVETLLLYLFKYTAWAGHQRKSNASQLPRVVILFLPEKLSFSDG